MPPSQRWRIAFWKVLAVLAFVMIALFASVGGLATNVLSGELDLQQIKRLLGPRYQPILIIFVLVAGALVAAGFTVVPSLWNRHRSASETQQQPESDSTQTPTLISKVRKGVLKQVEDTWVKGGRNEKLALPGQQIDLSLKPRPDLVEWVGEREQEQLKVWQKELEKSSKIPQIVNYAQNRLLILGEPGSGKSTVLCTIAEHLIEKARKVPNTPLPIPIIFELSEWRKHQGTLEEWLIARLQDRPMQCSEFLARELVEHNHIAVLLDGLDEMADLEERKRCVAAINKFIKQRMHVPLPLVVCCRTTDFEATKQRLRVARAFEVQPIMLSQVHDYLAQDPALEGLCEAVREQSKIYAQSEVGEPSVLLNMATNPFFLPLMTVNYRGVRSTEIMSDVRQGDFRDKILQDYITNGGAPTPESRKMLDISPDQLNARLVWLAHGMQKHEQKDFYIESLQPTWLATRQQQRQWRMFVGLISRFTGWLLIGLCLGLFWGLRDGLLSGLREGLLSGLWFWLRFELGILIALLLGALLGMLLGILGSFHGLRELGREIKEAAEYSINHPLRVGLFIGLCCGVGWLLGKLLRESKIDGLLLLDLLFWLSVGLVLGVLLWMVGLLFRLRNKLASSTKENRTTPSQDIIILERPILKPTLRASMRRNSNHELFDGLYYGLGVGLLVWWRYRPDSSLLTQVIILVFCLVFFGFVGLLVGLVTGVGRSFESIYEAIPNRPNEGIRRSLQDGFIGALLVGLFWGLLAGLPSGLVSGPSVGLSWGLFVGLLSGVFGGLRRYGGKAVIQHYILRSMLSRSGAIPLRNLVPMLEEARRRRLLVRVGGGYKFFHEEIQKYYTARSPVLDVVGPKLKAISQVVEQEQA